MNKNKEYNFIYYSDDKLMDGNLLFGDYINYLQKLKEKAIQENNVICKDIVKFLQSTFGVDFVL
jgi:hypothetical protein